MSENLGAGIKLANNWDLTVDSTGDLATVSGRKELQKDIAVLTAIQLSEKLGGQIGHRNESNVIKSIELVVRRLLTQDSRIQEILSVTVQPEPDLTDTVIVEANITVNETQNYDLIFEVEK